MSETEKTERPKTDPKTLEELDRQRTIRERQWREQQLELEANRRKAQMRMIELVKEQKQRQKELDEARRLDEERKEAERLAELRRLEELARIEEEKRNEALRQKLVEKWISAGCHYNSSLEQTDPGAYKVDEPPACFFDKGRLEEDFWNSVANRGGWSNCPDCGAQPYVNRVLVLKDRPQMPLYMEGLFAPMPTNDPILSNRVETIQCCDHLFDLLRNKRYIRHSKLVYAETMPIAFHTYGEYQHGVPQYKGPLPPGVRYNPIIYTTKMGFNPKPPAEWVTYNINDPDGSIALQRKRQLERDREMRAPRNYKAEFERFKSGDGSGQIF